jgi:predicted transcriptional regulator
MASTAVERAAAQSVELVQREDSKRVRILEFIKSNPGTHLRRIKRELNLAMGVIQYHLYKLEREHRVVSVRHGLYKRYYADKGLKIEDHEILNVLSQETERDLVLYLIKNPQATQKELSEFGRISASSTNWHMKRLAKAGFVEARRSGGFVLYRVRGDPVKILSLLRSHHPRIWDKWAERMADLMA